MKNRLVHLKVAKQTCMTNIDRWWPATPFFMKESLNLFESLNEVNNKYNQQIEKFFDKLKIVFDNIFILQ